MSARGVLERALELALVPANVAVLVLVFVIVPAGVALELARAAGVL